MARGNDAAEAQRELEARQGVAGNAEYLIQMSGGLYPRELRAANSKAVNPAATSALSASDIEKHIDGEVLDYAVRGDHVVAVVVDETGRSQKVALPLGDLGAAGRRADRATEEAENAANLRAKSRSGDDVEAAGPPTPEATPETPAESEASRAPARRASR